jgi:hypothetical protein
LVKKTYLSLHNLPVWRWNIHGSCHYMTLSGQTTMSCHYDVIRSNNYVLSITLALHNATIMEFYVNTLSITFVLWLHALCTSLPHRSHRWLCNMTPHSGSKLLLSPPLGVRRATACSCETTISTSEQRNMTRHHAQSLDIFMKDK